jgi:hypothetical protein|nr:toprim domain-containing protein [Ruegeria sp. EL01]
MRESVAEIRDRLGDQAEMVCRHYLPAGRREGNYWLVGDIHNTPGRSMYVRLTGGTETLSGKWTDAATGEFGDLFDIIESRCGLSSFGEILREARRFLSLPPPEDLSDNLRPTKSATNSPDSARRLIKASQPMIGSLAEVYLRGRDITHLAGLSALRYHPRCFHRPDGSDKVETWPALIAAVTELSGQITGAHRTWLTRDGSGKAPLGEPRKAMGSLLGNGVRFGMQGEVLAAGEGIETVLSVRQALPHIPLLAALSSGHLGAILFPPGLRRLYVLRDNDPAGNAAVARLCRRAEQVGIEVIVLMPRQGDFNDDLRQMGEQALRASLRSQLLIKDRAA